MQLFTEFGNERTNRPGHTTFHLYGAKTTPIHPTSDTFCKCSLSRIRAQQSQSDRYCCHAFNIHYWNLFLKLLHDARTHTHTHTPERMHTRTHTRMSGTYVWMRAPRYRWAISFRSGGKVETTEIHPLCLTPETDENFHFKSQLVHKIGHKQSQISTLPWFTEWYTHACCLLRLFLSD